MERCVRPGSFADRPSGQLHTWREDLRRGLPERLVPDPRRRRGPGRGKNARGGHRPSGGVSGRRVHPWRRWRDRRRPPLGNRVCPHRGHWAPRLERRPRSALRTGAPARACGRTSARRADRRQAGWSHGAARRLSDRRRVRSRGGRDGLGSRGRPARVRAVAGGSRGRAAARDRRGRSQARRGARHAERRGDDYRQRPGQGPEDPVRGGRGVRPHGRDARHWRDLGQRRAWRHRSGKPRWRDLRDRPGHESGLDVRQQGARVPEAPKRGDPQSPPDGPAHHRPGGGGRAGRARGARRAAGPRAVGAGPYQQAEDGELHAPPRGRPGARHGRTEHGQGGVLDAASRRSASVRETRRCGSRPTPTRAPRRGR